MTEPWNLPTLVTTRGGVVHIVDCARLSPEHESWPWDPKNDGPGVARACKSCLKNGLPT